MAIGEKSLGDDPPKVAEPLRNVADFYRGQGKYEQAEPLYQQALRIWEQALGPEHPNLAYPFHGLAILFTRQGKYEQAEPLRSEEHTSELQSHLNLVCRLLLEKKKKY